MKGDMINAKQVNRLGHTVSVVQHTDTEVIKTQGDPAATDRDMIGARGIDS